MPLYGNERARAHDVTNQSNNNNNKRTHTQYTDTQISYLGVYVRVRILWGISISGGSRRLPCVLSFFFSIMCLNIILANFPFNLIFYRKIKFYARIIIDTPCGCKNIRRCTKNTLHVQFKHMRARTHTYNAIESIWLSLKNTRNDWAFENIRLLFLSTQFFIFVYSIGVEFCCVLACLLACTVCPFNVNIHFKMK